MEQQLHNQEQNQVGGVSASSGVGGGSERLPQWSPAETREFIFIRTELDQRFVETKRNKRLWEAISSQMLSKGFHRTPEQCKSKWKNLLTRFKGSEIMGEERGKQAFPYYDEMRNILFGREQRILSMEGKKISVFDQEEEDEMHEEDVSTIIKKKKKRNRDKNEGEKLLEEVSWALKELARRQNERQIKLLQIAEAREIERQEAEMEWRKMMEMIYKEREEMEKRWREREEEWRARQEIRAERRDTIISSIFTRLGGDDGS